jgi:hypothetical protein
VLAGTDYPMRSKLQTKSYESPLFETVFHLVRCPMAQISSFTSHLNFSYDFIRLHMIEQIKKTELTVVSEKRRYHENSMWNQRNYTDFFQKRRNVIIDSGRGCSRGGSCWLHFAGLSWLFWNSHIQR